MAILSGYRYTDAYTANHHFDLFANHGCGLLHWGVACECTRKSCIDSPPLLHVAGMALADILPSCLSASSLSHTSSNFQDSYGVDGNESPLDQAYFSQDFIHETEPIQVTPTTYARPHVQTSRNK